MDFKYVSCEEKIVTYKKCLQNNKNFLKIVPHTCKWKNISTQNKANIFKILARTSPWTGV
jgi:hypothetical protein